MIQRIQTVFLFLAAIASSSTLGFAFVSVPKVVNNSTLFADGRYTPFDHALLVVLFAAASTGALANIFQFRQRKRQLLINRLVVVGITAGMAVAVALLVNELSLIDNQLPRHGAAIYLPVVATALVLAASYFIRKDENLVRSMDRLR